MRSVVRIMLLTAFVAACGDASEQNSTTQADQTAAAQAAPASEPETPYGWMPAPEDTSRRAGSIGEAADAAQVVAVLKEWEIDVSPDTIQAGEVTISFQNRGERPHAVEVRNERAGRWRSMPVPPGGTVALTMPLAPANFEIVSTTDAYVERGMRAMLIVR